MDPAFFIVLGFPKTFTVTIIVICNVYIFIILPYHQMDIYIVIDVKRHSVLDHRYLVYNTDGVSCCPLLNFNIVSRFHNASCYSCCCFIEKVLIYLSPLFPLRQ